jgi:HPt (histidine-containing phosphotransfer) domain-containing protein
MLVNNPRFQKEYRDFSEKISQIEDENVKLQMNQLLQKLLTEARSIDRQHEELIKGARLSSDVVSDHRSSLIRYRHQLAKKLANCEISGLIKSQKIL